MKSSESSSSSFPLSILSRLDSGKGRLLYSEGPSTSSYNFLLLGQKLSVGKRGLFERFSYF